MTTYSWSTNAVNTDATAFRAWGSSVGTALTAIGLVNTADTGQINWTTVSAPSSSAQMMGYEIWRFDDSLQGTYPIYFKLEYGSGSSGGAYPPGWKLTVGKGSDGAGTITGGFATAQLGMACSTYGSDLSVASHGPGGFSIYLAPLLPLPLGFTIERSLDSTGTPTGNGVAIVTGNPDGTTYASTWYVCSYANNTVYNRGFSPIGFGSGISGGGYGSGYSLSPDGGTGVAIPIPLACPGVTPWISRQLMALAPGDTSASGVFTAAPYGISDSYRGFGVAAYAGVCACPVFGGQYTAPYGTPAAIYWA